MITVITKKKTESGPGIEPGPHDQHTDVLTTQPSYNTLSKDSMEQNS
jgi:hypothetical protein